MQIESMQEKETNATEIVQNTTQEALGTATTESKLPSSTLLVRTPQTTAERKAKLAQLFPDTQKEVYDGVMVSEKLCTSLILYREKSRRMLRRML